MKIHIFFSIFIALALASIPMLGNAQITGQNPVLNTNKNNGYLSGVGKLPVETGDLVGRVQLRGWVTDGFYHPGVEIRSVVTGPVSSDGYYANLLFRTGYPSLQTRLAITAAGRVGIGTNEPDFDLHTVGNTHTTGNFYGRIHFDDNQASDDAPDTYSDEAYFELKQRSVLGLPTGLGSHGGLLSLAPGASSFDHQLFFADDGIFTRRWDGGAGSWAGASWYKLLTGEDIHGTPNRVVKFTGVSSLGDSQLWDDGIQVGIGTDSPTAGFLLDISGHTHIKGNAAVTANLGVTGSATISGFTQINDDARIIGTLNLYNRLAFGVFERVNLSYYSGSGDFLIENQSGNVRIEASDEEMMVISNTEVEVKKRLMVTGADLAERFKVNLPLEKELPAVLPGMVLSIDKNNPGELAISQKAYDRTVAGVASGAGGVNTAMLLGQEGTLADGDIPVAIVGRVYCYVDADYGAVEPGDLLTTSPTVGHAMKVTDFSQAQGTILGKAMTALDKGKGLVLVLISIQ